MCDPLPSTTAFAPKLKADLIDAITECLKRSSDCPEGPRGPIGEWDVSSVADMGNLFDSEESYIAALRIRSEKTKAAALANNVSPRATAQLSKPMPKNQRRKDSAKKVATT